jgi:hypothetical protein
MCGNLATFFKIEFWLLQISKILLILAFKKIAFCLCANKIKGWLAAVFFLVSFM